MIARRVSPWPARRIAAATAVSLALAAAFVFLHALAPALFVVLLGLVLATAAAPALKAGARWGMPRALTAAMVFGAVATLAVGAVVMVGPLLVAQASRLAVGLPELCGHARDTLAASPHPALSRLARVVVPIDCSLPRLVPPLALVAQGVRTADWLRAGLWGTLGALLVGYAWSLERPFALRAALLRSPPGRRQELRGLLEAAEARVGAYVRGQAVLSAVTGVCTCAAYLIIGVPNAVALGGLAACAEVIPVVGPLVAVAAGLLAALPDHFDRWPAIAVFAATLRLVMDYGLMPAVMGRSVGVNPLLMLGSLAVLGQLGGVLGAMVAIPFAAVVQLLLERTLMRASVDQASTLGRDRVGRLRYEAAALSASVRRLARRSRRVAPPVREIEEEIEALADAVCHVAAKVEEERRA